MKTLAQRLRDTREAAGLSQSALARAVGIKPQTIQLIEAGKVKRPRHLIEIANALKVSGAWLSGAPAVHEINETPGLYRTEVDRSSAGGRARMSADALVVARLFTMLDPEQRRAVLMMLKTMTRQRRKNARQKS